MLLTDVFTSTMFSQTPPVALLLLLPVRSTDKGGELGMGSVISCRKNQPCEKMVTTIKSSNHLRSALPVEGSSLRRITTPYGETRDPSEVTTLMPLPKEDQKSYGNKETQFGGSRNK